MNVRHVRAPAGLALVLTLLLTPSNASGQETAVDLTPVASVEGITEYQLDNGLRVLLFPDQSKPQITVNITYLVGGRHEGYGETGMAHLLEHLLFQGSTNHPDIPQELNERGAQPNGTTYYDRTNYFETFPANEDNLEWALDLEADRMVNSFVSREDLDSEMTVVRNEMELGENNPYRMMILRTLSAAYLWHNYGKAVIGARSDVENVPIERLQAFYRKYYQPDNAVLIVAGNFDDATALEMVVEKFADIPRPERTGAQILYETYTREPTQDGERRFSLRRVGDVQLVTSLYHVPPGSHPDYAAIDILGFVLGDSPSGRLYKALVDDRIAANASANAYQFAESSPFILDATVPLENDVEEALRVMNETVAGVLTSPVTGEELGRAKTARLNVIERSFNSSASIALQFSEWAAMGDWRLFFLHRDRIEALTAEDVNRVAQAYLKPDNRTVGVFYPTEAPDRATIPDVPDVQAMVVGYEGREVVAQGEAFDPSPANIESRTIRYTLSNGMEVALMPKETRGDQAVVRIRLHFGDEESLLGRGAEGGLAGSMLMRGTERLSRQDIQDELDRLKASGSVEGSATLGTGQFQTERANMPEVIRLMGEIARTPVFPEDEFQVLKEQHLTGIDQTRSDPQALAQIELARRMREWPAGHPNYTETPDEERASVEAVSVADVRGFYRDFWGPQRGNVVVVGDFDEAEVRAAIEEALADWESPHAFRRIAAEFYDPPAENVQIETPDKANAIIYAQQNFELSDTDPDYAALVMAGYMIGGGVMKSRLSDRLRQQDGLSYGTGGGISAHPIDPTGQFVAAAIFAPENLEALETAMIEELERVLDAGFTEGELTTAQQGWLEGQQLARAQDGGLAGMLSSGLYFDRTLLFDRALEDSVRSLSVDEVNQAIRSRLDLSKMTIIKAGDFAKSGRPVG